MSFSAWNGLGLALVIPCVQSLIADVYTSSARGRAFGLLFLTSNLGERPASLASLQQLGIKMDNNNICIVFIGFCRSALQHCAASLLHAPACLGILQAIPA